MNRKLYKNVATPVVDNSTSEISQRIAYSLGYDWIPETKFNLISKYDSFDVLLIPIGQWLVFNPNDHSIYAESREKALVNSIHVVSPQGLLAHLKNPIEEELVAKEEKKALPLVVFDYPSSKNKNKNTQRFVKVVEYTDTHLKGFDVPGDDTEAEGKFKAFLITKMTTPKLVWFSEKKRD